MGKIIIWLIGSCLSAIAYRAGGADKPFNTKYRDLGCPLIAIVVLWLLDGFHLSYWWAYLISFGLMFGSLTTYWGKKGDNKTFLNFWLHGAGIALSFLAFSCISGHWIGFSLRFIMLPLAVAFWSVKINNAVVEELGRGFFIGLSLPLLLI